MMTDDLIYFSKLSIMYGMFYRKLILPLFIVSFAFGVQNTAFADTSVASRIEGENVYFYTTLHEAVEAAGGISIDNPDEITLLIDIIVHDPLIIEEGQHIRLVAGNSTRTIQRSSDLLDYPVIWVKGEAASLTLGKPGMEHLLIVDGGYRRDESSHTLSIIANTPIAVVNGPDSKLVMYDNISLQNNCNNGSAAGTNLYSHAGGVFIRTEGDLAERLAEFVMKGGTIQGNFNNAQTFMATGGGVLVAGFGLFTMEGGAIKDNTAVYSGGGVSLGGRASFRKTGGIIYGKDAPDGLKNIVLEGESSPKYFAHAVRAANNVLTQYRNDTVGENDHLSYMGNPQSTGVFGVGEKWDNVNKALQRRMFIFVPVVLILFITAFFIIRKKIKQRQPKGEILNAEFTSQEEKVLEQLLTHQSIKMIASELNLTYAGVSFHCNKIYQKADVKNRTELLVKYGKQSTMSNEQLV
jgi:DNA-binding CsgD family transcriptional regulator